MANYAKGVVLSSTTTSLKIRLANNVIVETGPRPELGYMDPVLVAYDFSTDSVKSVFLPEEIPSIDVPPEVHEERGAEIGDEEQIGNFLDSKKIEEF